MTDEKMNRTKLKVDYIECAKGWQAEVIINATWTAHTKVLPTKEKCIAAFTKFAAMLGRPAAE